MTLDVLAEEDEPRIIDTHAHQPTKEFLEDAGGKMMEDAANKFGAKMETDTYDSLVEEYHEAGIGRTILLGWDAETNTGNPPVPNDYVAEIRDEYDDFFIGFGSVDPLKDDCVEEAHRVVEDLDLSGFKFQQIAQGFDPSDARTRRTVLDHRGFGCALRLPRRQLDARRGRTRWPWPQNQVR